MTLQLDVFRHSDAAQAAAYREAAKTARVDPHWTEEQRAAREASISPRRFAWSSSNDFLHPLTAG